MSSRVGAIIQSAAGEAHSIRRLQVDWLFVSFSAFRGCPLLIHRQSHASVAHESDDLQMDGLSVLFLFRSDNMTSFALGASTSPAEVTNVDTHGVWILVKGKEYFLPHEDFPWFLQANLSDILNVELHHESHLYWPILDIDLTLDSIENPHKYPLMARH